MNKIIGLIAGGFLAIVLVILLFLSGSYNTLVTLEEDVEESWAQVENVYQRRLDLIPNLVETVKGYAEHEKETYIAVTEARSKVAGLISKDVIDDPKSFQALQESQAQLNGALSRLLVVVEKYPDLKANQGFLELQSQLEGTENRITVERQRYNVVAKSFNVKVRQFPINLFAGLLGFSKKEYFKSDDGAQKAPKVNFMS